MIRNRLDRALRSSPAPRKGKERLWPRSRLVAVLLLLVVILCGTWIAICHVHFADRRELIASTVGTRTLEFASQPPPRVYIHVQTFREGVAGWSSALAEILLLASHLNAKVVEPCVFQGRLTSCNDTEAFRSRRLGRYLNLTRTHPRHWITFPDFQNDIKKQPSSAVSYQKFCLHKPRFRPPASRACGMNITNFFGASRIDVLERLGQTNADVVVLNITSIVINSLAFLKLGSKQVAPEMDVLNTKFNILRINDSYKWRVQNILQQQWNLTRDSDYLVIHWRGELSSTQDNDGSLDYMACAQQILRSREQLSNPKTILVSSMSQQDTLEWNGVVKMIGEDNSRKHAKNEALKFLSLHGIEKLEIGDEPLDDLFELVVMDLVLLQSSPRFATCSLSCHSHPCAACNYIRGKFPYMAVDLRLEGGKDSHECWPS